MEHNISTVIPSIGDMANLKRLLDSIAIQDFSEIQRCEVVVVFNKVSEKCKYEAVELAKKYNLDINFFYLSERGANLARNEGLRQARFEIVYFLDDDCELELKNTLIRHIKLHLLRADVFAFGAAYTLKPTAGFYDRIYHYLQMKWFYSGVLTGSGSRKIMRHLLGGNFSIKKRLASEKKIIFDNSIAYGGSEHEFFRTAYIKSLILEDCGIEVLHNTNENLRSVTRKVYKQGRGKAIIDAKLGVESQSENAAKERSPLFLRLHYGFFNYVFWYGYYAQAGKSRALLKHILKDVIGFINKKRYELLTRITKNIN